MKKELQIIPTNLLETYLQQAPNTLKARFNSLEDAEISTDTFVFMYRFHLYIAVKLKAKQLN